MKKISYFLSLLLLALFCGCKEQEQPYVGYIIIERAVLDAAEGSTTTITADTDIPSSMVKIISEGIPVSAVIVVVEPSAASSTARSMIM